MVTVIKIRHLNIHHYRIFIHLFCACMLISSVYAHNKNKRLLNVNVIPYSIQQRSFSPIPVTLQFHWNGIGLISGKLEIQCFANGELKSTIISDELTLRTGISNRSMLLPVQSFYADALELKMRFISENGSIIQLQSQTLQLSRNPGTYSFNICEIRNSYASQPKNSSAYKLTLEKLAPLSKNIKKRNTNVSLLQIERLPVTIFGYCAYDIVFLRSSILNKMDDLQLSTLKNWVLSGGALLLLLEGTLLNNDKLTFINDLIEEDLSDGTKFPCVINNTLRYPDDFPADKIDTYWPGLGRMVITGRKLDSDKVHESVWWRKISAFLWRVRSDRVNVVVNSKKWFTDKELKQQKKQAKKNHFYGYSEDNYDTLNSYNASVFNIISNNIQTFLPAKFSMIPLWVLSLILICFILMIGPVEYIVLGKLGFRKFTWLTFPLTCIGFSFMTVYTAEYYTGRQDYISSMTVIDESSTGKMLRKVEYEIIFPGSNKTIERKYKKEMHSNTTRYNSYRYRRYNTQGNHTLLINGRLFTDYSVFQNLEQWIPKINRIISFQNQEKDKHSWKFPHSCSSGDISKFAQQLRDISDDSKFYMTAVLIDGGKSKSRTLTRNIDADQSNNMSSILTQFVSFMEGEKNNHGLFSIISELSPSLGYRGSELMIMDNSDKKQKLLIVCIYSRKTRNVKIFRKLYRDQ